ncbi:uncharacterized protein LOC110303284 [Mus caroli]|uniref:Uncharacterized protein LOC110303284 n=1 Tax=Mus caroli TaxID=10089 RepID=A0A6P5QHL3_MUSCR|nr:uncharacterized protein LOC110303284 [Mus caroli]
MRGKLEVERRRPRRNLRATCRAEGAMLSALSAAGGARRPPARAALAGGRAASAAPGPGGEHARPVGSGAILPGGTTPAPDRRGRAGPRLPARAPPRLSSRRSPAPSTNQRRRRALGSAPRRLAPEGRPCSPQAPGMLCAASPGGRRPLGEKW